MTSFLSWPQKGLEDRGFWVRRRRRLSWFCNLQVVTPGENHVFLCVPCLLSSNGDNNSHVLTKTALLWHKLLPLIAFFFFIANFQLLFIYCLFPPTTMEAPWRQRFLLLLLPVESVQPGAFKRSLHFLFALVGMSLWKRWKALCPHSRVILRIRSNNGGERALKAAQRNDCSILFWSFIVWILYSALCPSNIMEWKMIFKRGSPFVTAIYWL